MSILFFQLIERMMVKRSYRTFFIHGKDSSEVRPVLQADGGGVELVNVQHGIFIFTRTSVCGGCDIMTYFYKCKKIKIN